MARKTIAKLEAELSVMKEAKDRYYTKYRELEEEKEREQKNRMMRIERDKSDLEYQVKNLLEIIRWQINPATTTSPFMPTKDQRDEERRY